jgi:hypothetical protein
MEPCPVVVQSAAKACSNGGTMNTWSDGSDLFNPHPRVSLLPITPERACVVIDDALQNPQQMLAWAAAQQFRAARDFPYPGLVLDAPAAIAQQVSDYFALRARGSLAARRTQSTAVRFSLVTVPPDELDPVQWQCHRDRLPVDPQRVVFAAMVLYLFRNPALGGTSFYRPLMSAEQTERMIADSLALNAGEFGERYGLRAGYMSGSNRYFERVARVPAAWNRMIFYDGGQFHSADVPEPALISRDPGAGRLTLNGFFTCTRRLS